MNTRRDPASLWHAINDGLGRRGDGALRPTPEAFADYFDQKVSDVRSATNGMPAPEAGRFLSFAPITSDIVCWID